MISVNKDFDDVPVGLAKKGWKDTSVMAKLEEIYHGKCAYSEEKLEKADFQIHHYRPKADYEWLENEWSNLHLISPECNKAAGDEFPVQGRRLEKRLPDEREWRADSKPLLAEKPTLLNPEVDTPENHLYFDALGTIYPTTDRGQETIGFFHLNSPELVKKRKKKIECFRKKFKDLFDKYIQYLPKMQRSLVDGKRIHDILFKDVFNELKREGEPQSEFSLLGRIMLHDFDRIIGRYLPRMIDKDQERISDLSLYLKILKEARVLFTKTDDILKLGKTEKIVPFLPEDPEKDERRQKGLPYAIKAFEFTKFYGIKHTWIQNLPINARWIFLTGENGFGKTLILQALVLGLFGKEDEGQELGTENCRVEIEIKHKNDNLFNIAGSRFQYKFQHFAAYGLARLSIDGDVFEGKQAPEKIRKTDSLFQNTPTLYNIQEYLIKIHGSKKYGNKFNTIIQTLKKLLPWVEEIIVDDSAATKKILYRERAENGEVLEEIPFSALSAGSRSIISMIGDMLIELFKNQEIDDPAKLEGIVIIDEIDVHLHAKWQREFVIRLTDLFPRVQFIASTHSPIPLLGAPPETVILNVEKKSKKEGIVVRRLDSRVDVSKLTPNAIWTSPVFDFEEIIPKAHRRGERLHTADDYSEIVFNKILEKKLDKLAKTGGKSLAELVKKRA